MAVVPPSSTSGLLTPGNNNSDVSNGVSSPGSNQSMNIGETAATMMTSDSQPTAAIDAGNRVWEKPWKMNELKNDRATWTLSSDSRLLLYLQEFSKTMISRTHEIEQLVDSLHHEVKNVDSKLENSFGEFLMLSNTQFIENRVADDTHEHAAAEKDSKQDNQEKTREQREKEIIPRFKEALSFGLSVLTDAYEQLDPNIDHSDSEDEEGGLKIDPILEAKDLYAGRPLPYLIGCNNFRQDDNIGLGDNSSEESPESDHGSISESEDEERNVKHEEESSSDESFSSYESADDATRPAKQTQAPKKKPAETFSSSGDESSDEDLFNSVEEQKKKPVVTSSSSEEEETSPKKPANFTDELAARIGGGKPAPKARPVSQDVDEDSWQDSVSTQRTESVSSHKKKRHQKHKTEKEAEGKVPPVQAAPSKQINTDYILGEESSDDDKSPFSSRAGLFSAGGKLFDDEDEDDEGGLFDDHPTVAKPPPPSQTPVSDDDDDQSFSASVSSTRIRGKTESGRIIPVGAVPMFGDRGSPLSRKFTTSKTSPKDDLPTPSSQPQQQEPKPTQQQQQQKRKESGVLPDRVPPPDDNLFGDDDDDLFAPPKITLPKSAPTIKPKKPPVEASPAVRGSGGGLFDDPDHDDDDESFLQTSKQQKPAAVKENKPSANIPTKPPPISGGPPPLSSGGLFDEDDDDDLFSAPKPKAQPVKPKAQPAKPKPQQQKPPPSQRVASLFDNDDEDEDGGDLFSFPAKKAPSKPVGGAPGGTSAPGETLPESSKAKPTASSLFADLDDGDDDDDDLFATLTKSKPSVKPSKPVGTAKSFDTGPRKKTLSFFDDTKPDESKIPEPSPVVDPAASQKVAEPEPVVVKQERKRNVSMFDDDEVDEQDGIFSTPNHPGTTEPPSQPTNQPSDKTPVKRERPRSLFADDEMFGAPGSEDGPEVDLFSPTSHDKPQQKPDAAVSPAKSNKPFGGVSVFGAGVDPFSVLKKSPVLDDPPATRPGPPADGPPPLLDSDDDDDDLFAPKKPSVKTKPPPAKPQAVVTEPLRKPLHTEPASEDSNPFAIARQQLATAKQSGAGQPTQAVSSTPQDPDDDDDDDDDLFAPRRNAEDRTTIPQSSESMEKRSPLAGLMIDPTAMLPGAVHPKLIQDTSNKPVSFEEPVKSASLQSFTKARAKGQGTRRPPTRSARRATTQVTAADLLEAENSSKKRLSLDFDALDVIGLPQTTEAGPSAPTPAPPSPPKTNNSRDIFGNDDLFGEVAAPPPVRDPSSAAMTKSAAELESDLFGTKSRSISALSDDLFPAAIATTTVKSDVTPKPTTEPKQTVKIDDDLFKEDESLFVKKKTTRKAPLKTADADLFSDTTDIFSDLPAQVKKKPSSTSSPRMDAAKKGNKTASPAASKKVNIFDDDSFDLFATPSPKTKKTTNKTGSKPSKPSASSDIFDDPLNAKK